MAELLSEDEQVEAIKQWLKKNGPGIVAGIAIGLAAIGGWRWWQNYQANITYTASSYYEAMLTALREDAPKARGQAAVLTDNYADTTYGVFAAFMLAKLDAESGDHEQAIAWLEWVLAHTEQRDLVDIARLRLAHVLLAANRLDGLKPSLIRYSVLLIALNNRSCEAMYCWPKMRSIRRELPIRLLWPHRGWAHRILLCS
ncbi:MAG: tetratricopeptide repeat protein [Gammaproteobacteria bacterium]